MTSDLDVTATLQMDNLKIKEPMETHLDKAFASSSVEEDLEIDNSCKMDSHSVQYCREKGELSALEGNEKLSGDDEDEEREEAFREIVENAPVDVVPPVTGDASHPQSFSDYFFAKMNKTKIVDFPSWDSPNQSPEFKLYVAKTELIKVSEDLARSRQEDAAARSDLARETRELETKQNDFSKLIVDTEPFIQQNKEIRSRFERTVVQNETKEKLLRQKTQILREDTKKFTPWEKLMKSVLEKYEPFQDFVNTCLQQSSGDDFTDITSLMSCYMSKLYAKYDLLTELYDDVHTIDVTKHEMGKKIAGHGETVKQLTEQVSDLKDQVRELSVEKSLLEKQRELIREERKNAASQWSEVQKSLDNAYKLFVLDAPSPPGRQKNIPNESRGCATKTRLKSNQEKVNDLRLQHNYLSQVLKVATRLYDTSDDTLRAHVSTDTIQFSM